jgi:gas vesicle protein
MMEKTRFLPFILGGLFGLVIAILFAPRSGEETRQLLVENNREIKDNALESIQAVQEAVLPIIDDSQTRIETINQVPKERLAKLQDIGQTTLD